MVDSKSIACFAILTCNFLFFLIDDSFFTSWANWAECSSDCEGAAHKTRTCQLDDSDQCISSTNVTIECNTEPCSGKLAEIISLFGRQVTLQFNVYS